MNLEDFTLDVEQQVEIAGPIQEVFNSVLFRLGEGNALGDGTPMQMQLEDFAGGRWFRDRGEGVQHLWGHVQVIKAPVLLELSGPMFMSYPVLNHIEVKLEESGGKTTMFFRHRAFGLLDPQHKEGVKEGWWAFLNSVKGDFAAADNSAN